MIHSPNTDPHEEDKYSLTLGQRQAFIVLGKLIHHPISQSVYYDQYATQIGSPIFMFRFGTEATYRDVYDAAQSITEQELRDDRLLLGETTDANSYLILPYEEWRSMMRRLVHEGMQGAVSELIHLLPESGYDIKFTANDHRCVSEALHMLHLQEWLATTILHHKG